MPWLEARLRGQKVLARASADGKLAAEGGRVEIRYKPTDGRAYRAAASNLVVAPGTPLLPDDTCVAGESVQAATKKVTKAAGSPPTSLPLAQWTAYADGACSGNPGPGGAGFVVIGPDGKIYEGYEYLGPSSTNNVGELTAILHAVQAIPAQAQSVLIYTDSKYAIGVLTKGWKAKANTELIGRTKSALAVCRNVRLEYVPGHSGVPMNERADELAREAIRMGRSQPLPGLR